MREHTQLHYDFCAPLAPQLHYDFDSKGKGKSQGKFLIKNLLYFNRTPHVAPWCHGATAPRRQVRCGALRAAPATFGSLRRGQKSLLFFVQNTLPV